MLSRQLLVLFLLCFKMQVQAQSYSYNEVLKKSEKALKSFVPKHLMPFTKLYYTPYYSSEGGKQEYYLLEQGKSTEGKLKKVMMRYQLKTKFPSCPAYDSIDVIIEMNLDSKLKLVDYRGLEFVPDFVMKNQPCHLMTKKQVVELLKKKGIDAYEGVLQLDYNQFDKRFEYYMSGDVVKSPDNPETTTIESILIDAATGEVLENTFQ